MQAQDSIQNQEIEGQLQGVKEKYIFVFSNYGFAF